MFGIKLNTKTGRVGELRIGKPIETPINIPTTGETIALRSPIVPRRNKKDYTIGVHVKWIDYLRSIQLSLKKEIGEIKYSIKSYLKQINLQNKLLHFEFYKEVKNLDINTLEVLMKIQDELNLNVIEIPNSHYFNQNYRDILKDAMKIKKNHNITKPIMAVVCDEDDLPPVLGNLSKIDGIGVNLKFENIPLLFRVRNKLKKEEIWIHSFSTQKVYRSLGWEGTIGPLINFFGIDSLSTYVQHPRGIRGYYGSVAYGKINPKDEANKQRFFNPIDYSKKRLTDLKNSYGDGHQLNNFCNCPICSKYTIGSLRKRYRTTFLNNKLHELLSYTKEAKNFTTEMKLGSPKVYIKRKAYANRIIRI